VPIARDLTTGLPVFLLIRRVDTKIATNHKTSSPWGSMTKRVRHPFRNVWEAGVMHSWELVLPEAWPRLLNTLSHT
jgi:hypothetical protein